MNVLKKPPALVVGLVCWFGLILLGYGLITAYSLKSGSPGHVSTDWVLDPWLSYDRAHPTLLMVVHPLCPCSKAGLHELSRLMLLMHGQIKAYVIVLGLPPLKNTMRLGQRPKLPAGDWTVLQDPEGQHIKQLGVKTSGHTLLYDTAGRLVYSGGLTQERGHEGDNNGESRIIQWMRHHQNQLKQEPVFGCPLRSDLNSEREEVPPHAS